MTDGYRLPADAKSFADQKPQGFATPKQDAAPQRATFLPKRMLPIIFLPGVMGSNLRITDAQRIKDINSGNNIAWRPDKAGTEATNLLLTASTKDRQLMLDPLTTEVDSYDPSAPPEVSGDERNDNVKLADGFSSPLLANDPPTKKGGRTAEQRARERGWGEVYFNSYGEMLQLLEGRLNNTFSDGKLRPAWADVVGVDPARWMADPKLPQAALTADELKKVATGCCFPVYAFGYNWLRSNGNNAR